MIKGRCKEGMVDEAYELFRKMEADGCMQDSCTFNRMIQGFLHNNDKFRTVKTVKVLIRSDFFLVDGGAIVLDKGERNSSHQAEETKTISQDYTKLMENGLKTVSVIHFWVISAARRYTEPCRTYLPRPDSHLIAKLNEPFNPEEIRKAAFLLIGPHK
ncbi:hypothetical protein PTKIN_Ptkin16aG0046800 [Pterospermum kingtungense]